MQESSRNMPVYTNPPLCQLLLGGDGVCSGLSSARSAAVTGPDVPRLFTLLM